MRPPGTGRSALSSFLTPYAFTSVLVYPEYAAVGYARLAAERNASEAPGAAASAAAAIVAALYPDEKFVEEGYLFFCNANPKETRSLVFAKTYEEHLENVEKYKQYWN